MQDNENDISDSETDLFQDESMFDQIDLQDMEFEEESLESMDSEE